LAQTQMMAKQKRNLKVPIILGVIAFGIYLLSIYMQLQQTTGAG